MTKKKLKRLFEIAVNSIERLVYSSGMITFGAAALYFLFKIPNAIGWTALGCFFLSILGIAAVLGLGYCLGTAKFIEIFKKDEEEKDN